MATMAKHKLSPAPLITGTINGGFLARQGRALPLSTSRLFPLLGTRLSLSHLDWTKAMSWPWGLVMDYGLWR
uniref:Uncharacterized protein n=1 Tax=Fagus sylvatica TaxID=28930 RepID=A0A2N9GWZ9_FAGSY